MNYDNKLSSHYRIAEAIFKAGRPLTLEEIATDKSADTLKALRVRLGRMCFEGDLQKGESGYDLTIGPRRYFNALYGEKYGVAEPRVMVPFKPLSADRMLERIHAGRIRTDVSFINGGVFYQSGELCGVGSRRVS